MKLKLFLFCVFLSFGIVIYKINYTNHEYYTTLLEMKTERIVYGSSTTRGRILDRNGKVLVDNVGTILIAYHKPVNISIQEEINIAKSLTPYLKDYNVTVTNLKNYYLANNNNGNDLITGDEWRLLDERKISNDDIKDLKWERITDEMINYDEEEKKVIYLFSLMNEGYSYDDKILLKNISEEELAKINALNIVSIRSVIEAKRVYPYGETLKSIFGTIGSIPKEEVKSYLNNGYELNDIVGTSGLEKQYEDILKGEKAKYYINSDNTLEKVSDAKPGEDLVLNIDIDIQLELENILKEEMLLAKKKKSSVYFNEAFSMVGDPKSGGVIALAGLKLNNENEFNDISITAFTSSYAMGSVVKGASNTVGYLTNAIEVGKKIKDSCVKLYSQPSKCSYQSLGYVDDITALKTSSNYYQFITAIKSTGQTYKYNMTFNVTEENFKKYRDVFASYGLGNFTGIDFPNEQKGMKGQKIAGDLLLNFAIGQYDTYTPISLLQYINTIANYGNRYAIRLKKNDYNVFLNQVGLDSTYYDRIIEGFYQVFHGGTATSYANKNLNAVGKTGTAETFYDSNNDGVVDTEVISSTLAYYFPRENPTYSIVVVAPYLTNTTDYRYPFTKNVSLKISNYLTS
mgnify:CR=1 FL=1